MLCLRCAVIALALALVGPSIAARARADEDTHVAALLELFDLMDTKRILDASIEQSMDMQIRANPTIADMRPILREFFRKYVSYDSLKGEMVRSYMKALTERETRELLAFYKTPTGRKAISVVPKLMSEMGELGMHRVQSHLPELKQMLEEQEAATKNQKSSAADAKPAPTSQKPSDAKGTKPAPAPKP